MQLKFRAVDSCDTCPLFTWPEEGGVRVLTAHQSKGLEFEVVFVAGLCECEFPTPNAIRNEDVREDLRVFYVALTRAQQRLFLTGRLRGPRGGRTPSRFLRQIGPGWREEEPSAMHKVMYGYTG